MAEKTRYSDAELEEFRAIINEKLELAQRDYEQLKLSLMGLDGNDTDDKSWKKEQIHCRKKRLHVWLNAN